MSAERRRIIAVIAVLTLITATGTFWLIRLASAGPRAEFVAGASEAPGTSASTTTPSDATTPSDGKQPPTSRTPATRRQTTSPSPRTTKTTPPVRRSSSPARTATRAPAPPPIPDRAIRVGGATLDNDNPRTPCVVFKNTALGVAVRITAVRVSGSNLKISAGDCAEDDNIKAFPRCASGMTLRLDRGCYAGVRATTDEPGEYAGTVRLGLRVRCTTTTVAACDVAELRESPPSSARPVDITWSDSGRRACFKVHEPDPEGGEPPGPFCESEY
jgi:hypothetical protein